MTPRALQIEASARMGALGLDVSLEFAGTLAVVGPNGAGKSSLLAMVLGTLPVTRGRIALGEEVLVNTERRRALPLERRRLGYVPQHDALFPHLSVRENVEFALAAALPGLPRAQRRARAGEQLDALGLGALAERRTTTLSGGEKQRVALARALAAEPRALLLDEPLAALDVHARSEVRGFLAAHLERLALPTLLVTHDPADARQISGRVAALEGGRVTQVGTWEELCCAPQTPFVAAFVGRGGA